MNTPACARSLSSRSLCSACLVAMVGLTVACNRSKPTLAPEGAAVAQGAQPGVKAASTPDFNASQTPGDYTGSLPASQSDLAVFAWQEFVALNWPAVTTPGAVRGTPDTGLSFLQPDRQNQNSRQPKKPVWMGYYHRNEMLPANTNRKPPLDHTSTPTFNYDNVPSCDNGFNVTPCGNSAGKKATTCFQTDLPVLDEASQLGLNYMFAQPSGADKPYQVLFMAKANQPSYDYVVERGFYIQTTSDNARKYTASQLANFGAICQQTSPDFCGTSYCLPCGAQSPYAEGAIHVKTAWRRLTPDEAKSGRFFTADVVAFKGTNDTTTCTTEQSWGLIGLHIIHKTVNFPAFVFASWEQVDNLASNLTYQNTHAGGPDPGLTKHYVRAPHGAQNLTLPSDTVQAINNAVHQKMQQANPNLVWQYYQLVGVQGTPVDYAAQNADLPDYYLANNVIESNAFFQSFVGTSGSYTSPSDQKPGFSYGPDGTTLGNNVFTKSNGKYYDVGGCQGCHGNAQRTGSDMSFLFPPFADSADAMNFFEFRSTPSKTAKTFAETLRAR